MEIVCDMLTNYLTTPYKNVRLKQGSLQIILDKFS